MNDATEITLNEEAFESYLTGVHTQFLTHDNGEKNDADDGIRKSEKNLLSEDNFQSGLHNEFPFPFVINII